MSHRDRIAAAALFAALLATGCIPSNVLDSERRIVSVLPDEAHWEPACAADLPGYYESEQIRGAAAGAFLKVYYFFAEGGSYSGAALCLAEGGFPEFQTLSGSWHVDGERLHLGDDDPEGLAMERSEGRLRLTGSGSALTLHRVELE